MVKSLLSLLDERKLDHFELNINEHVLLANECGRVAEFWPKTKVILSLSS